MELTPYLPWIAWEQVDIPTTGLKQSDAEEFRNSTDDDIFIDRVLFDIGSTSNTVSARFGKHGSVSHTQDFCYLNALHNVPIMAAVTDCAYPLLKLRKPALFKSGQPIVVEIRDTGSDEDTYYVSLIGYRRDSRGLFIFHDWCGVGSLSSAVLRFQNDLGEDFILTDIALNFVDTGTVARMRGRQFRISGGGLGSWSNRPVPMSLHFPDRNGAAYIWSPPGPLILRPGEAMSAEFRDTTGSAVTVYWSVIGYRLDRRS